jgi:serralysin
MSAKHHAASSKDVLRGSSDDDTLHGTAADDQLRGYSGDDELRGHGGDDKLSGGSGDDRLLGGSGDDKLSGGSGDDVLRGGSGDDDLSGGSGDDVLRGGSGDDNLSGGSGDDSLYGGSGDDVLKGGSGDDLIVGGSGDDRLSGGSGDDIFRFSGDFGDDVITDLKDGDTIDLTSLSSVTDLGQLDIRQEGSDTVIEIPGGGSITVKGLTPSEVLSHVEVACLARGTLVRTPRGETPVEALAIGDEILTVDGEAEPIKWIGRRAYAKPFIAAGPKIAPILFRAHSLGPSVPSRDLYVSPEHAMLVDDALVPARLLVNGDSIRQVHDFDRVEYFHLEFDSPQVILTSGAASESYVESENRRMFANYGDYVALYGEDAEAGATRRFPLVEGGRRLEALRERLTSQERLAS